MRVRFADPKTAGPFKKLFGTEAHKDLLIALLNALLRPPPGREVCDAEYLSPRQLSAPEGLKRANVEARCMDASGERFIVKIRVLPVDGFEKRVVLNACKAYVEQLDRGEGYPALSDVVAVTICNFTLWSDRVPMVSRWRMREEESGEAGLGQVQYVFLELPKLKRSPSTLVERWAWFFREAERLDAVPPELAEEPFPRALEVLRRANFDDAEWTAYEREKMAEQDYRGGLGLAH